jgi:hypothetical protein
LREQPIEHETDERHAQYHADQSVPRGETSGAGAALVHARGKTLADQPGHDQHHALNAERDQDGKERRRREIAQAVEGRVAGGERQRDGRGAQQRELPVVEHHLLDDAEQTPEKSGAPQGQQRKP